MGIKLESASGISQQTADLRYLKLTGGTLSGAVIEQAQLTAQGNIVGDAADKVADNIQVASVTTGSVGGSATVTVTVNWPTAFPDTSYEVFALVEDSSGFLHVPRIASKLAGSVDVRVENADVAIAHTGTLFVLGMRA